MCRQKPNIPSDCTQDTLTKCTSSSGSFFFFLLFSFTKIEHEHHHGLIVIKLFRCYSTKSSNIVSRFLTIMMLSYLLWLIKRVSFWVCFLPLLCIENCHWIKKGWLLKYYACVKPNWPFFFILLGAICDCNIGFPQWHSMAKTQDITRGINRRQEPGAGSSVLWAGHLP